MSFYENKNKSIAIDGLAGSGKSTIARDLAKALCFFHLDTGAFYRTLALWFLKNDIDFRNEITVSKFINRINLNFEIKNNLQIMYLDDKDVTEIIRSERISMIASVISSHKVIRNFLINIQRKFANENNVVMDGRDIGSVVLKNASVKIYLKASLEIRTKRRYKEALKRNDKIKYNDIANLIKIRDFNDINRSLCPLVITKDSIVYETSNNSIEKCIDDLLCIIKNKLSFK